MPDVVLRGRSEQMAMALGLVRTVMRAGQARGLVVTGEAGIGKSALVSAIVREAGRMGAACGSVRADQIGRVVPGGPLLSALRDGANPVLPAQESPSLGSLTGQPLLMLDAVADALEQRAAQRPVVIAIDDVQWLDDLSAFLLRSLPGRLAGSPVAWLLASRNADLPLLNGLCDGPAREVAFSFIRLGPLENADVIALARDQLGTAPDGAARELLRRAEGNPFLATQVVSPGGDAGDLPDDLVRAVRRQLRTLPANAVALVRLVAVYGEPLSVDDAAELLDGATAQSAAEAADEAIVAGMLNDERGMLRFRHGLVREAVYEDLPPRTRQLIHRACARRLREAGSDALAVAAHARKAVTPGDEEVALLLADAADEAVIAMPNTAAELMLTAFGALRAGQPTWIRLGHRSVELLSLTQRCTEALAVADQLLAYLDDDESVARVEIALSRVLWLTGRWNEAERRSRAALERPGRSPVLQARLASLHALALSRVRPPPVARPAAEHALAASAAAGDRAGRLFALHALAEITRNAGDHSSSLSYFRRLRAESEPTYLAQEIMALQHLDRYAHAATMLGQAWQQAGNDSAAILPSLLYAQIWQDYNLARLDDAEATAGTLMRLGQELGSRICQLESASVLSAAALLRGAPREARRRISLGGEPSGDELAHIPVLTLVRGWLLAEEGDPESAVALLTPLLKAAPAELDPWPWKPGWLRMLARTGLAAGDADFTDRAADLAAEGARRNPGVATFAAIALGVRGLRDNDLDLLTEAANVVASSPRPLVRAEVYEDCGRARLSAGDLTRGGELLDNAWAAYDEVGADGGRSRVQRVMRTAGIRRSWWSAGQSRPAKGWAALTDAEMRVARLIGAGNTNKSAATQLGVSRNTVGTHLRSVFTKLDVQSRVQLANQLRTHDLPELPGLSKGCWRRYGHSPAGR